MGFTYEPEVLVVTYDDPAVAGLEVRTIPLSVGEMLMVVGAQAGMEAGDGDETKSLLGTFLEKVQSWNLEDGKGDPIPLTERAIHGLDHRFVQRVTRGWMRAVTIPPAPLGEPSPSGGPAPEASLPMDPL